MKKIILITFFILSVLLSNAQIKPSQMSPATIASFKNILGINEKASTADLVELEVMDTLNVTHKATVPTKQYGTITNDVATTEFVNNAGIPTLLKDLKTLGSTVVSVPYGATMYAVNGTTLTSQRPYGSMHIVRDTTIVTGVEYAITNTPNFYSRGAYSGFDLCNSSGVQLAITDNDTTVFKTNGAKRKAFPTPVTLVPGIYYVRALWVQSTGSTAPALAFCKQASGADYFAPYGTSYKTSFYQNNTTTLGTGFSMGSVYQSGLPHALHLYYQP